MDSSVFLYCHQRISQISQQQPLIQITFSPQIQRWLSLFFFFPPCLGKSTLINQIYWFCQQIKTEKATTLEHICSHLWLCWTIGILDNYSQLQKQRSTGKTYFFSKMSVIERELNVDLQKSEAVSLRKQSFNKSNAVYNKMNHFLWGKPTSMIRQAAFTVLQRQ